MQATNSQLSYLKKAVTLVNRTFGDLLDEMPPGVEIEYGLFNRHAAYGPAFTPHAGDLRKSLSDLTEQMKRPGLKSTALYDALREGLALFDAPRMGDSILVVTDGQDNESRLKAGKVQQEAAQRGVRVFTILFRDNEPDIFGTAVEMLYFAERTGGSVHVISVANITWRSPKAPEEEKQELRRFWNNEVL